MGEKECPTVTTVKLDAIPGRKQKVCDEVASTPSPSRPSLPPISIIFSTIHYIPDRTLNMPKRTSEAAELPAGKSAAVGQDTARAAIVEDEEMGEFEDRWEDEIESEHEAEEGEGEEEEEGDGE